MRIETSRTDMNGALRDNIYFAYDNNDQRVGMAAVVEYTNTALIPNRPLNYYIILEGFARARDLLFGAAYTKARLMRQAKPEMPARIYSACSPRDPERLMFFADMGFDTDDTENVMRVALFHDMRLYKPPVGTSLYAGTLHDYDERERLLNRINRYSITARSQDWLAEVLDRQFAIVLSIKDDDKYLGEAIVNGYGAEGRILTIYTIPQVRRHGIARALLSAAHELFLSEGYSFASAKVWDRCESAVYLFESMGYRRASQSMIYPGRDV